MTAIKVSVTETTAYTMDIDPGIFPAGYDFISDPDFLLDAEVTRLIDQGEGIDRVERTTNVLHPDAPDRYYIRALVERRQLHPDALTMDPREAVRQHNEARYLTEEHREYLILPSQRHHTA